MITFLKGQDVSHFSVLCPPTLNYLCGSCNLSECSQKHLLECSTLIGKNEIVSYIPNYIDIFNDNDIKEQVYIENLKRKKAMKESIESYSSPCAPADQCAAVSMHIVTDMDTINKNTIEMLFIVYSNTFLQKRNVFFLM